jgi:hypothetical protein
VAAPTSVVRRFGHWQEFGLEHVVVVAAGLDHDLRRLAQK